MCWDYREVIDTNIEQSTPAVLIYLSTVAVLIHEGSPKTSFTYRSKLGAEYLANVQSR